MLRQKAGITAGELLIVGAMIGLLIAVLSPRRALSVLLGSAGVLCPPSATSYDIGSRRAWI